MIFLAAARDSEMIRWTRGLQREPVVDWQEDLARREVLGGDHPENCICEECLPV